jgi:hypothetical protein
MKIFNMKKFSIFFIICLIVNTSISGQTDAPATKQTKITDEINLSESEIEVFKEVTRKKVDEFQQYIVTLSDKEQPLERRNMAEREAIKLFYQGALMEVSYIDEKGAQVIKSRTMENYLYRLKTLPYTKVIITFYDIAFVTEFIKGPDNKYFATATIFQEFKGFTGDQISYTDVTQKEIEIVIEQVEDKFYNEKRWKIFLGNIKATETSQNKV